MKMPGVLLLLLFPLALFLAAQSDEEALPSVFDGPVPECNCTYLLSDINVTRAIEITQMKFQLKEQKGWLESGMAYIDMFHAEVTQTVHVFSANADVKLASWTGDKSAKKVPHNTPREGNVSEGMSDYFNRLFHDTTYLSGTEKSYLIFRVGYQTNKEEGPRFLNSVRFAISLPKTQNHLQIYVGDPFEQEDKQTVDDRGQVNSQTEVGVRYFIPDTIEKNLKTSISAGFRGIGDPYTQLRFEYPVNYYDWLIRPLQYFDYSVKRAFYEETDLYFDRRISKIEMVRLRLQRATQDHTVGMAYGVTLSYFNTFRFGTGFHTYLGMVGQTVLDKSRYEDPHYDDVNPGPGVYRYSVGAGWKSSFLRSWLFYEIDTEVNFDMLYNWRPNYINQFWLEVYFGDT